MNILLMSMPDIGIGYPTKLITVPDLALCSLAGNIEGDHNVKIADLVLKRDNLKKALSEALEKAKPDMVGLSGMTPQYGTALKIAKFLKKRQPGIKVAIGSYHASLMYEEIAAGEDGHYFDFIFRGEAELSFNEVVNKLESGEDLRSVAGLSFRANGKFVHNRDRELADLEQIKLPDRSGRIWDDCNVLKMPFDAVEFSRGCPMSCSFCSIRRVYGKSFRTFDPQRVIKDIETAKKRGVGIVFFTDANMTLDIKKLERLCDEIIARGHNDIFYAVQAGAAGIAASESMVKKMARAGFKFILLGIESMSKKTLKELNKGDIIEESRQAVKYLRDNDIVVAGGFIVGNPDDDYESIEETFKFARDLQVDFTGMQFLTPFPATPIRDKLLKQGFITNKDNYKLYNVGLVNVRTKHLSHEELGFFTYRLMEKYLKTKKSILFRIFMRNKKAAFRLFKGAVRLLPALLGSIFAGLFSRLFLSEKKRYRRYKQNIIKINEFNI